MLRTATCAVERFYGTIMEQELLASKVEEFVKKDSQTGVMLHVEMFLFTDEQRRIFEDSAKKKHVKELRKAGILEEYVSQASDTAAEVVWGLYLAYSPRANNEKRVYCCLFQFFTPSPCNQVELAESVTHPVDQNQGFSCVLLLMWATLLWLLVQAWQHQQAVKWKPRTPARDRELQEQSEDESSEGETGESDEEPPKD